MKTLVTLGVFAASVCFCFGEMKIATVDQMLLVKSHPQHENNRALLKSTDSDYRKRMDGMQEQLKSIMEEGRKIQQENSSPMLSDKAKREAMKKLEGVQRRAMAQQQDMRAAEQRFSEELQDLQGRLIRLETEDIRKKMKEYGAKHGYDLILDKNACAFAQETLDITDDVLKEFGYTRAVEKSGKDKDKESK